jgi:hypothetical protein
LRLSRKSSGFTEAGPRRFTVLNIFYFIYLGWKYEACALRGASVPAAAGRLYLYAVTRLNGNRKQAFECFNITIGPDDTLGSAKRVTPAGKAHRRFGPVR